MRSGQVPLPGALALSGSHLYYTTGGSGVGSSDGSVGRISVDLKSPPSKTPGLNETLAQGQMSPSAIAIDAVAVYWVTLQGDLHRLALAGGPEKVLAAGAEDADVNPQAIALDDTHVYWTSWGACLNAGGCGEKKLHGRVQRVPKTGGAKEVLAEGGFLATGIAVDKSAVYWTNWWFTSVARLAL